MKGCKFNVCIEKKVRIAWPYILLKYICRESRYGFSMSYTKYTEHCEQPISIAWKFVIIIRQVQIGSKNLQSNMEKVS